MPPKHRPFVLYLLAGITACLLLVTYQCYPATLSRLLTGRMQASPRTVTVTSWPNNRKNTFTIDDPAVLEQLSALLYDVPLSQSGKAAPHFPAEGCYRFSLDGGREVLTDGIYLYAGERTYTARTLPALQSLLYRTDEKAQFYTTGGAFLPPQELWERSAWDMHFYAELEAFGLDSPGEFYVVGQREDGLWWCYTAPQPHDTTEALLASRGIVLPARLGSYRLTQIPSLRFSVDGEPWNFNAVVALEGDFQPGCIYDWSDRLTVSSLSAGYVGPAENPGHHKPDCAGLFVSFDDLLPESQTTQPPGGYTEEPSFDGGQLCAQLAGWQVKKVYSYAMGDQFEKGWLFTASGGGLSGRFVKLSEVSDPTDLNWYRQALHRDMTPEELAREGQWLLPLLEVTEAMKGR